MLSKKILVVACLFMAMGAAAQNNIIVKGDTIILSNGTKFWLGQEVTLGSGSSPDKSFSFIYEPELLHITKRRPLNASYYAKKGVIKKFQRDGAYRHGYSYNIIVLDLGDRRNYWCDVQGALDNNEIISPLSGPTATSKEAQLARLKKLLDSGDITKEEYETLRNKILNSKDSESNNTKKGSTKPIVF